MKPFLKARWLNLINITWVVEQELLQPFLPSGISLDLINGKGLVSLVAFEFRDTRFKGLRFPFHVHFPEINLRFYVRSHKGPGVVFIRELVEKPLIAWIANAFFHERYKMCRIRTDFRQQGGHVSMEYAVGTDGEHIHAVAEENSALPEPGSLEEFIENRFLGFSSDRSGTPMMFHVAHEPWEIYPMKSFWVNLDFGKRYGKEWAFLAREKPLNAMFIKGSEVGMFPHRRINPSAALSASPLQSVQRKKVRA